MKICEHKNDLKYFKKKKKIQKFIFTDHKNHDSKCKIKYNQFGDKAELYSIRYLMTKWRCKHWHGLSNSEAQTLGQSHLWVVDFICQPKFHRNFNCTKGIKFLLDIQHTFLYGWQLKCTVQPVNYVKKFQQPRTRLNTRRCSVWSISMAYASDSEVLSSPLMILLKIYWKMSTFPREGNRGSKLMLVCFHQVDC